MVFGGWQWAWSQLTCQGKKSGGHGPSREGIGKQNYLFFMQHSPFVSSQLHAVQCHQVQGPEQRNYRYDDSLPTSGWAPIQRLSLAVFFVFLFFEVHDALVPCCCPSRHRPAPSGMRMCRAVTPLTHALLCAPGGERAAGGAATQRT